MNADDDSIPLLTEVITPAPATATENAGQLTREALSAPVSPPAMTPPGDWREAQQEITENVLQALLRDIDGSIERTVEEQLDQVLASLSTQLRQQLKRNLEIALEHTVALAVAEEIRRMEDQPRGF